MIKLENSQTAGSEYAGANKIISAVKTGGSVLLAILAVGGIAAKQAPKLIESLKKNK